MSGYTYVLLSALGYSAMPILLKLVYAQGISPLLLLMANGLFGCVFALGGILFYKPELLRITWPQGRRLIIQGLFGNLFASACYFFALQHMTASLTTLILFTHPALVMLLAAVFYKERLSIYHYLSLVAILIGCFLAIDIFSFEAVHATVLGLILAVGASFGQAFVNFYGQKTLENIHPMTVLTYIVFIQTLGYVSLSPSLVLQIGMLGWNVLALIAVLAAFTWLIPNLFILKGLELIGASRASLLSTVELPLTIIWATIVLGERMNWVQAAGGLLILGGLILLREVDKSPVVVPER